RAVGRHPGMAASVRKRHALRPLRPQACLRGRMGGDDRRGRHHCCRHQVAHAVRAFRWDGTSLRRCQLSCVIARLDRATQYASVSPGLLGRPLSRAMTRLFDSIRTKHALAAALRPHHTLVAGLYLSDALEVELLYAFAL